MSMEENSKGNAINRSIFGILIVSLFLNTFGIWYGLPYPSPPRWIPECQNYKIWSFDTIAPLGPLAAGKDRFSWGRWSQNNFTYPLGHYLVLGAFYSPYVAYLFCTDGIEKSQQIKKSCYPYGLAEPRTALTVFTIIGRVVSGFMGTGVVLFCYLIAIRLFGRKAAIFSALTVALCSTLVYYAHDSTLNVPYIFWSMVALYAYVSLLVESQIKQMKWYIIFGASAAMALSTKDQAYAMLILLPIPILICHYRIHKRQRPEDESVFKPFLHRNLLAMVLSFIIVIVIANNLIFNFPRFILHLGQVVGRRDLDRLLDPSSVWDHFRLFLLTLNFIKRSMGLPLFLVGIASVVYCIIRFPKTSWPLIIPLFSYYFLFIVGAAFYVHARHALPLAIIAGIFAGKLIADLMSNERVPSLARKTLCVIVFVYSFVYAFSIDLTFLNDSRLLAGEWIRKNVPKSSRIEIYSSHVFLPRSLEDYHVYRVNFDDDNYQKALQGRVPEYIIITEEQYRNNSDRKEIAWLRRGIEQDENLKRLFLGHMGYQLQASFKYKLHCWFFPDMFFGINPRIFIFMRTSQRKNLSVEIKDILQDIEGNSQISN